MGLRFTGTLEKKTASDYGAALDAYLGLLEKSDDVVSVYTAGSVRFPGLSDLDVLLVLSEQSTRFSWKDYSVRHLDANGRYLFMHEPFVVPESQAAAALDLYPLSRLTHLAGKRINFQKRRADDALPFMAQEAVLGYLFWPHRILAKKTADLRSILPQLAATRYEAENFKLAGCALDETAQQRLDDLLERADDLRARIFERPLRTYETTIAELIVQARQVHDAMLHQLDRKLAIIGAPARPGPYLGLPPKVVWFGGTSFDEGRVVRRMPGRFAVMADARLAGRITDPDARRAFLARHARIAAYERFVFSHGLQKFMMLTQLHTRRLP